MTMYHCLKCKINFLIPLPVQDERTQSQVCPGCMSDIYMGHGKVFFEKPSPVPYEITPIIDYEAMAIREAEWVRREDERIENYLKNYL